MIYVINCKHIFHYLTSNGKASSLLQVSMQHAADKIPMTLNSQPLSSTGETNVTEIKTFSEGDEVSSQLWLEEKLSAFDWVKKTLHPKTGIQLKTQFSERSLF